MHIVKILEIFQGGQQVRPGRGGGEAEEGSE